MYLNHISLYTCMHFCSVFSLLSQVTRILGPPPSPSRWVLDCWGKMPSPTPEPALLIGVLSCCRNNSANVRWEGVNWWAEKTQVLPKSAKKGWGSPQGWTPTAWNWEVSARRKLERLLQRNWSSRNTLLPPCNLLSSPTCNSNLTMCHLYFSCYLFTSAFSVSTPSFINSNAAFSNVYLPF